MHKILWPLHALSQGAYGQPVELEWCNQPYVREEDLNIQISDLLKPFSLRADWADEMLKRVNEEKKKSAQTAKLMAAQKRTEIEKNQSPPPKTSGLIFGRAD